MPKRSFDKAELLTAETVLLSFLYDDMGNYIGNSESNKTTNDAMITAWLEVRKQLDNLSTIIAVTNKHS